MNYYKLFFTFVAAMVAKDIIWAAFRSFVTTVFNSLNDERKVKDFWSGTKKTTGDNPK